MGFKHMPGGLFPHFDSGFERRPYFARNNEVITIGCRLDNDDSPEVFIEIQGETDKVKLKGEHKSTNEINQRYFQFVIETKECKGDVKYRFITSGGEVSKWYSFSIVKESLIKPVKYLYSKQAAVAIYKYEDKIYELKVEFSSSDKQKITFTRRFNEIAYCDDFIIGKDKLSAFFDEENLVLFESDKYQILVSTEISILHDDDRVYELQININFPGEAFFGFGEKFDSVNQAGLKPMNYVIEQFAHQQDKSYFPIPFFFSESGVGLFQSGTYKSVFDLSRENKNGIQPIKIISRCPSEGILYEAYILKGNTESVIKEYTALSGKPALPPIWSFGPWISSNGWNSQAEATEQIAKLNELQIPATVMVLEAWSDEETFYIWNDAIYKPKSDGSSFTYDDFAFDENGKWPNPKYFTEYLDENNVKLVLWQIPVIKHEKGPHGDQLDLDTKYAIENGLCVKNDDGTPYRVTEMWFGNSLIPDFTNKAASDWWFAKRRYLVDELGVSGFKTDGGEFLFDLNAKFSDGRDVNEGHNDYPNIYEGAYYDFLDETIGVGKGVLFSRAGYSGGQKFPIHWAGDQLSEFSELKAQLRAGLSLGLSGVPFWGFDIGGFAGSIPSRELYLRSVAMAAFAPVMQFHSEPRSGQYFKTEQETANNDRSPWNLAKAYNDNSIIEVYRFYANLRMNLLPYIWREAQFCVESSRPLMAHMVYDFFETDGKIVLDIEDQYMFGRDFLVAPIIEEGADKRKIYLPKGNWYDFFTGELLSGGEWITRKVSIGNIGIFVRENTAIPVNINSDYCMGTQSEKGKMSSATEKFENLCFLLYGKNFSKDNIKLLSEQKHSIVFGMSKDYKENISSDKSIEANIFGKTVTGMKFK